MSFVFPIPPIGQSFLTPDNKNVSEPWRRYLLQITNAISTLLNVVPGGPAGAVQFKDGSAFTGDANLIWDGHALSIGGSTADLFTGLLIDGGKDFVISLNGAINGQARIGFPGNAATLRLWDATHVETVNVSSNGNSYLRGGTTEVVTLIPSSAASFLKVNQVSATVLSDSTGNPLITTDANELLTFPAPFNVGQAPYATSSGDIRWGNVSSIWGLNGAGDTDVPVLMLSSDQVTLGDPALTRIDIIYGDSFEFVASAGGSGQVFCSGVLNPNPSFFAQVSDNSGGINGFNLEGPADSNALYPSQGTPDLGTSSNPWKDGYFSGNLDTASLSASGTPGVSFSGPVTNITVVNGIVTAAS